MMARSNETHPEAGYIDARPPTPAPRNPLATHGWTIHPGQSRPSGAARRWVRSAPTSGLQSDDLETPQGWLQALIIGDKAKGLLREMTQHGLNGTIPASGFTS